MILGAKSPTFFQSQIGNVWITTHFQAWESWAQPFVTTFSVSPHTLPETNIAPENKPLEKEIPIGNHHF